MEDKNRLIPSFFGLVSRRRELLQEIKLKKEQIRNLKREFQRLDKEIESSSNEISGGRNNDRRKK
jgi:predicted  nucleic acid-binding Zn-ribbon protein